MKTKASVELAFVVTLRNRRRIIEQTNDSEAIVSLAKYPQAEKREPCVKKTSVELGFFTLRLRRRMLRLFGDLSQTEPKYPQPEESASGCSQVACVEQATGTFLKRRFKFLPKANVTGAIVSEVWGTGVCSS